MYRLKISGNFFLILNDSDLTEHSRHPSKDVRYQIYDEQLLNPTIGFFGLYGKFNSKKDEEDIFKFDILLDENGISFSNVKSLTDYLDNELGKSSPHVKEGEIIVNSRNIKYIFSNEINSEKVYFIDEVIDITGMGINIEVPSTGIAIKGHDFDRSGIICHDDNYTLFTSPTGGSGNILDFDLFYQIDGTNSKLRDIKSFSGFEAIESNRVNFIEMTSMGVIDNYRQGLETGTGRFGGTPTMELKGVWLGGFRITTSITRNIDDAMTEPLFKAVAGFVMNSRFLTDMNVDLGSTAPLLDFSPSNFTKASILQLQGMIITRNGVSNSDDSTITPNIDHTNLESLWLGNEGINNTFVGGRLTVTTSAPTTILNTNDYFDLVCTFTASNLQHYDSPANGQLRHLGSTPREYKVIFEGVLESGAGDVLLIKMVKWDNSEGIFVDVGTQERIVNSLPGSRDVAFFNYIDTVNLDENDYIKFQVRNSVTTTAVTPELDTFYLVEQR